GRTVDYSGDIREQLLGCRDCNEGSGSGIAGTGQRGERPGGIASPFVQLAYSGAGKARIDGTGTGTEKHPVCRREARSERSGASRKASSGSADEPQAEDLR